jgi:hypothetical protein
MTVPIGQYYLAFRSTVGALVAVPFLAPLASAVANAIAPDSSTRLKLLYPPLGDAQPYALVFTVACGLVSTFLVYFWCERHRARAGRSVWVLSFFAAICFVIFFGLCNRFVKVVHIGSKDTDVFVSIGYERSEFTSTNAELSPLTDMELLHARPANEDQIQKLWTFRSLFIARALLWAFYTCVLVCLVSIFSVGVYQHAASAP